ncbi:hypothetical protein [Flavobacterium sp.]|uniref:hypothetical protein n=1 Tax=Flavobacterium sp. TaxID=239 RepID=UPI00260C1BF0|nr:hypothetical protein [Flavobacterium sp.]
MNAGNLTYYHCTSDIFLDSILENGLGKINPNFDLKLLDLLNFVFEIAKIEMNDETFESLAFSTELMINQEIKYVDKSIYGVDVLNFKHDGVFLSLGDRAAITHSHHTKYGSEILTRVMLIVNQLRQKGVRVCIPAELNQIDVESLLLHKPKPIFIKVLAVDDKYLYNQHDRPLAGTMRFIEEKLKTTSDKVKFAFNNTSVYKYIKPILVKNIEVYYLDYDGHPIDDDFEYYLTRIN